MAERKIMTDFDCVIIASVDLGPPAIRQLSLLLDAHRQARIRTGILSLRSGRTDLGWLGDDDVTGRFDDDVVAWLDPEARCSAPLTLSSRPCWP
jgi:hypothetical protein